MDEGSSHWTFRDLQSESAQRDFDIAGKLPMSIIVPLNLLSGASSPSNLILNLIPTDIFCFLASRYLLTLTIKSERLVLGNKIKGE